MIKKTVTLRGVETNQEIEKQINKITRNLERYVYDGDGSAIVDIDVGRATNHHRSGEIFEARVNFRAEHIDISARSTGETPVQALDEIKRELASALQKQKKKKSHFTRRSALRVKNFFKGVYNFRRGRKKDEDIFEE